MTRASAVVLRDDAFAIDENDANAVEEEAGARIGGGRGGGRASGGGR